MDLRQLEYFLAVVEHGGVTSAARALRVAQPSLSDALRALERELGTELLHRVSRGVVLTAAGTAMLGPARRALRDRTAARSVLDDLVGLSSGRLEIVAWSVISTHPLSEYVAAYRRRYPQITVHIADLGSAENPAALVADGRHEIALTYLPVHGAGVSIRELGRHEMFIVFPPGDEREDWPDPVPVSMLAGTPLVNVPAPSPMRSRVESMLAAAGVRTREVAVTGHRDALVPLAQAGVGASVVSQARARHAAQLGMAVRHFDPPVTRPYGLLHRDGGLSPAGHAFVDLAVELAGDA
jgi:DNA-binding transcriptional LysR family regulator